MKYQRRLAYLGLALILTFAGSISAPSVAITQEEARQKYNANQSKLAELNSQIKDLEAKTSALSAQASSLENEIAMLQSQQATLQAQIELKEAEHEQIVNDIENIKNRIAQNQDITSIVISQYYYNSGTSTIERLASSESFASYLDNEMRLDNMADTLVSVINENKRLKQEAEEKKAEAEQILADLSTQKSQLEALKQQQATLLAETRSSEAEYQAIKNQTKEQKQALENEQAEYNRILSASYGAVALPNGDPNKGGYPYSGQCPAAKLNGSQYADRWGMYICECVSYAAYKVYANYGNMPYWGGIGNANQWVNNARRLGIPYGATPKPGAVGISLSGPYGHAVWVESVNGNRVTVSQYNYRIGGIPAGQYSEMTVNSSMFTYIYFGEWHR